MGGRVGGREKEREGGREGGMVEVGREGGRGRREAEKNEKETHIDGQARTNTQTGSNSNCVSSPTYQSNF